MLLVTACLAEARAGMVAYDGEPVPEVSWGTVVGGTGPEPDEIDGIAIDRAGNTGISGVFRGNVRIGSRMLTSRGQGDIFLASFSPLGQVRWVRQIGGTGDDNTYDLRTDGKGNLIASGWFSGRIDFGGISLESAGSVDMFVAKFNRAGALRWARAFGGPQGDGGNELDVLDNGEIAVAGISEGHFRAGGITYPFGGGGRDSYLLRIGAGGSLRWVRPFNGPGTERIRAVAMNPAGTVFLGFQYRGVVSSGIQTLTGAGGWDGALAAVSAEGGPLWIKRAGGPGTDNVRGTAAGPDGSVYASGQFTGQSQVLGVNLTDDGAGDDFLMRLSADGAPLWTVTIGGPGAGVGGEIRSRDSGVMVSSLINGQQTINGPGQMLPLNFTGIQSTYLAGFSKEGKAAFAYLPDPVGGLSGAAPGGALAASPNGLDLAVSIRMRGQLALDGKTTLTSATSDSAVIRLALPRRAEPNRRARARIVRVAPRRLTLRKGRSRRIRVRVRNRGSRRAVRIRICLRGRCRRAGSLRPGRTTTVKLPIRSGMFRGRGIRRPLIRLRSGNAGRDSARLRIRLR